MEDWKEGKIISTPLEAQMKIPTSTMRCPSS